MCGGTHLLGVAAQAHRGLSPRVRGNLIPPDPDAKTAGSIPACAGEPSSASVLGVTTRVYPRVCGGTRGKARFHDTSGGLSPRVRRNLSSSVASPANRRSIPACAEEPASDPRSTRGAEVYPRVCGGTPTVRRICRPQ